MSKLDKLIAELCPDGVEYKKIKDICTISRGIVISKDNIRNNAGEYPVYSSQTENNGELGKISTFAYDGKYLTWTTDGANAGTVFYRTGKFNVTNVCGLLKIVKPEYSVKYVYHILKVEAPKYVRRGMGNPKLMSNVMGDIKIPLPPFPIQEEIVRILDNFTELTAELTAELTDRKKQYEYYRNSLLTFDDDVEWKTLEYLCESFSAGGDVPKNSAKGQTEPTFEYPYPIYANAIDEKGLYGFTDNYKIDRDAVTISARGAKVGYHTVREAKFTPIIRLIVLVANKKLISTRYLNYVLDMTHIGGTKGGIPQLTVPMVKKLTVPIPYPNDSEKSLTEQQRIVDILDRFDTLVNDIQQGLPAEIELRQKQYEYYRDKLLNFPRKELEV